MLIDWHHAPARGLANPRRNECIDLYPSVQRKIRAFVRTNQWSTEGSRRCGRDLHDFIHCSQSFGTLSAFFSTGLTSSQLAGYWRMSSLAFYGRSVSTRRTRLHSGLRACFFAARRAVRLHCVESSHSP